MAPPAKKTEPQAPKSPSSDSVEATRFSFTVEDLRYDAWLEETTAGVRVCVSCPLGNLPYSAENKPARRAVLMLLSASGNLPMARLMLTNYQHVSLLVSETVEDPFDPKVVLAGAAAAVLKSSPLRHLMNDCMTAQAA